jgi:hypothetical protein
VTVTLRVTVTFLRLFKDLALHRTVLDPGRFNVFAVAGFVIFLVVAPVAEKQARLAVALAGQNAGGAIKIAQ